MRNIVVLLVLLYVAYSSLAQNIVTFDDYIPYSGDIVIKEQLLHADAGNGSESCFWDFADIPVVSDEYKISYSGDSVLTSLTPDGIYKYVCDNDKLLLIRFETPLLFIDYNIPVTQMKYPMAYGDTASFSFSGTGKYCNFYDVKCHGHIFFEADGLGDILLVENDTLTDALRVHIVKECDISMNIPGDSTDTSDDIKREKEEFYIWYAKGCRHPVFETLKRTTFYCEHPVSVYKTAFRLIPEKQSLLAHSQEGSIDYKNALFKEEHLRSSPMTSKTVVVNDNTVKISYDMASDAHLIFIIAGTTGMIYSKKESYSTKGSGHTMTIDCGGLCSGEYILYINIDGNVENEKIVL